MFLNTLCTLPECAKRRSCAHLGPTGEHCFFEAQKELCELLNLQWRPDVTMAYLLQEVRLRLAGHSLPEELPAQFQTIHSSLVPGDELKLKAAE